MYQMRDGYQIFSSCQTPTYAWQDLGQQEASPQITSIGVSI